MQIQVQDKPVKRTKILNSLYFKVYAIKSDKTYLLKDAFLSAAKEQDIYLNEIPEFTNLRQVLNPMRAYFHLELPHEDDESKTERFLCEIRSAFPLNYGRLASLSLSLLISSRD